MKKLDVAHHKFIMIIMILVMIVIGVYFGVKLMGIAGLEAMMVLLFALVFVNSVLIYVVFTQLVNIHDDLKRRKRK